VTIFPSVFTSSERSATASGTTGLLRYGKLFMSVAYALVWQAGWCSGLTTRHIGGYRLRTTLSPPRTMRAVSASASKYEVNSTK
jgi:hypothetical protein